MSKQLISVAAAVAELDGHFFIVRRAAHKDLPGCWEFPGGKVEVGERPDEALLRELSEEFQVRAEVEDFIGSAVHDYGTVQIELLAFWVRFLDYDFKLSDHDQWRWVIPQELSEYDFAPADAFIVQALQTGLTEDIS